MRYIYHKSTLYVLAFLSFCFIGIGLLLQTILIPLQDFDLISRQELLTLQKEYAINYPLGKGLLYVGSVLLVLDIILFIIKVRKTISNR